ncbi:glycosyltransferase [Microbulbifer sp. OS29]|uniref:Glycosyltransferase n=1 Tax=Microbulbifer okhotskensis TaxID=2926617 RepID=A0A9X2EJG5_9GAMM|nr:glycosyltransferase family 2 protein [Microbulbifer okhotskensis]MCO1333362.1 glycosyltransferase [Microbulbifer okhotskensis]
MHPLLVICICTYQRPERLRNSLQSLAQLQLPLNLNVSALVVDNDSVGQEGKGVVEELSGSFPFPIYCVVEEQRGIPCARNRCIRELQGMGADYLVFIDDDEWAEVDWLGQLYTYAKKLGGSTVVCGSVVRYWPDSAPQYYSRIFYRQKRKTGDELDYCATSNVLIPMSNVRSLDLRFNEQDPLDAGEDVIFFTELKAKGGKIVFCFEARVYEAVPESRANMRWLSRRKFSAGITLAKHKLAKGRGHSSILLSAVCQLLISGIGCILGMIVGGKRLGSGPWLRACRSAGMACGVFGVRSEFYRVVDH